MSPVPRPQSLTAEAIPARQLSLYLNPTPLTLSRRERPSNGLKYGSLAALGLAGWPPAGLSLWMLEPVDVSTGLPWFRTIIACVLFWRQLIR